MSIICSSSSICWSPFGGGTLLLLVVGVEVICPSSDGILRGKRKPSIVFMLAVLGGESLLERKFVC
jgi:hypothetical protein